MAGCMTKCGFCNRELPEPGTDFVLYVRLTYLKDVVACCVTCMKSHRYLPVETRKVLQTTESQPPIS